MFIDFKRMGYPNPNSNKMYCRRKYLFRLYETPYLAEQNHFNIYWDLQEKYKEIFWNYVYSSLSILQWNHFPIIEIRNLHTYES